MKRILPLSKAVLGRLAAAGRRARHVSRNISRDISTRVIPRNLPPLEPPAPEGPGFNRFHENIHTALASWDNQQTQWWYFTGHLRSKTGRRFAYQLVLFDRRTDLDYLAMLPSHLVTPRMQVAHFALTDLDAKKPEKKFRYWQRGGIFERKPGFSSEAGLHFEIDGWWAHQRPNGHIQFTANADGHTLTLDLEPIKPLTYHGQNGYSPRGPDAQTASFYCSYSRLKSQGRLLLNGELHEVEGQSWMDHEKMLATPELFVYGWVWYSLQLESGEDLMIYFLRNKDGSFDEKYSFGSWIDKNGKLQSLTFQDIQIQTLNTWKSPLSKADYPVHTQITIPTLELKLEVIPCCLNSELDATRTAFVTYWEGAVEIFGSHQGRVVRGHGFNELVGYDRRKKTRLVHFLILPERHQKEFSKTPAPKPDLDL